MHSSRRTWRIRGIPRDVNREWLSRALHHHSDLRWPEDSQNNGNDVIIHTLAPDLRVNYQIATIRFHDLPTQLHTLGARDELTVKIEMNPASPSVIEKCDSASELLIDEHFDGITTLFSPVTDEEHQIDVLVVSGLGSHPFGSFVNKKDGNMWLTNNLPRDIPAARVMIFGYESKLQHSRSHVELDDLAGPVHIAISQISQSKNRPLLLIGHSLGGLLVKEALIRSAEPGFEHGLPPPLDMITGIILFGTPNDGLDIESLVPMVNDQPNRSLLESLRSTGSQMLRRQRKDFSKVLERTKLQLFCFYETELSPTATQDPATTEWKMGGPLRFLVNQSSATSCLPAGAPSNHSISIRRSHSDLVKFSSHDAEYDKVAYIVKQMQEMLAGHRNQAGKCRIPRVIRESQDENSLDDHQRRLAGNVQVNNSVKRPADDVLSPSDEKRPRLASEPEDDGLLHASEDPVLRDSALYDMKQVKEKLIRQLYFSKIDERMTHLAPAQGTTCRWFSTDSKYQSWQDLSEKSEHGGFLWIKGHPGTGKSTLMKYLFEEAKVKSRNDPLQITLSFFFLARGTVEEKTTTGLYRSLLHQLFEIAPDLKNSLEWMTNDGARTIQRNGWSEEALKQTLTYAVFKLGRRSLTMFVDALDECDADKADDMVSFFEELCDCAAEAKVQLHICFSSRYYPTVVIKKGLEVCLEDETGHTEDIRKYVKSRLRLNPKSKHAEALRSEILNKSSGIFLWVVLVVGILNNEESISIMKLREHLQEIPPRLNDLFQMILTRDGANLEQLRLCLNWILFAEHALKPEELYFAIQLGSDEDCSGFWDKSDLDADDMKAFVRSSSKGLAEVTRDKHSEVQFIHESVRDFLLGRYGTQWSGTTENIEGHGHQVLRDGCLAQLNASISQQLGKTSPSRRATDESLKFPFLKYSVQNVLHHSNLAQRNGIQQGSFLSEFPLQQWISLNNINLLPYMPQYLTDSASLLYVLGRMNLPDLIGIHSRRKFCFQNEAESCGTPIIAALAHNSYAAVRAFLCAQAEDESPTSPLHGLCNKYVQHRKLTSRLVSKLVSTRRRAVQVLHDLIDEDEEAVSLAFVLSPYGRDEPLDSSDPLYSTSLSLALERGHEALFRLLLQGDAHIDQKSGFLDSLLLQAAGQGSEAIIELLLDRGADVQPTRQGRQTPLWSAAAKGRMNIITLLLHKGAEIDSKNDDGETMLSSAARGGQTAVVRFLLMKGADIESRDNSNRTPMSWAAGESNYGTDVAELLLQEGADIDSRDVNDRTPLSWAAGNSTYGGKIAMLLLEKGADIDSKDKDGRTPLSWATEKSIFAVVRLLLEKGADIEAKDKDGRTPLSWAAGNDGYWAVRLLCEKGADTRSEDKDGRTPLSWASSSKYATHSATQEVIALLQEAGRDT